jgi:menaquinone-dependent protoporphyrinogen oxidase
VVRGPNKVAIDGLEGAIMNVLVAYASRHGATQGIAERIGGTIDRRGLAVTVQRAADVQDRDLVGYDAVVIGGAAYAFHWLKEATEFVRSHRDALASRPVWVFSCGPLGTEEVDAQGRDVATAAEPKEFATMRETIRPRGMKVFFGAYDPKAPPIGLIERFMGVVPAARDALPAGDFRDWPAIEAWADQIATELARTYAPA